MDYQTYQEQESPKGGRLGYAVAFAFGLGITVGGAIATLITNLLTR